MDGPLWESRHRCRQGGGTLQGSIPAELAGHSSQWKRVYGL